MRILIDVNLSPSWAAEFAAAGFEAIHWSEVGDVRALDREVLGWAVSKGYVVFTHDLDFGAILAATGAGSPSVVQVRTQNVTPEHLAPLVMRALRELEAPISDGALVTIQEGRRRVRILPLRK